MINSIGEHVYKLEVYPFSIKGLDYCQDFRFNVKEKSEKREKIIKEIEERDKKITLEKSFFQEMLSTLNPVNEEEESDDEENDKDKKVNSKNSKKKDKEQNLENEEEEDSPTEEINEGKNNKQKTD